MAVRVLRTSVVDSHRCGLRVAGWAAIVAALAFLVQPLSVGFLPFDLEEMRDPVELSRYWWAGTLQAAEFAVIAVSVLVLVAALRPVWVESAWGRATWVLGLASGMGFLLQAALSAATYSWWLMQDASSFTPDPEARSAVLFGTFVAGYTFLGLANLASAGWLMGLAASGRRSGLIGAAFAAFAVFVAAILTVGTLTGFTIPAVVIHLPLWLALGVKLLRSRPASEVVTGR
jgi:hypothetical protein